MASRRATPFYLRVAAAGTTNASIAATDTTDTTAVTAISCIATIAAADTTDTTAITAVTCSASISAADSTDTTVVTAEATTGASIAATDSSDTTSLTGDSGTAPVVPSTGAGRARRRQTKRLSFVEIDGERFFVESEIEAADLFRQARELAAEKLKPPVVRPRKNVKPVKLREMAPLPTVEVASPDANFQATLQLQAARLIAQMEADYEAYEDAVNRANAAQDDDDEEMLLLMD